MFNKITNITIVVILIANIIYYTIILCRTFFQFILLSNYVIYAVCKK